MEEGSSRPTVQRAARVTADAVQAADNENFVASYRHQVAGAQHYGLMLLASALSIQGELTSGHVSPKM